MKIFNWFKEPEVYDLKAKRDVRGLIKALQYKGNQDIRMRAATALGEIGDLTAVAPLIRALADDQGFWRLQALGPISALAEVGNVQQKAREALVKIGKPAVQALVAALNDRNDQRRVAAAHALGGIADACAVEPLIAALRDQVCFVRTAAAVALGEIGDARALDSLSKALKDRAWATRMSTAEALGKIGDTRSVNALKEALSQESDSHCLSALKHALAKIEGPQAQ